MLKKIFYLFLAIITLISTYFIIQNYRDNSSSKETKETKTVAQIKERQELELAIKKIYEEAGKELSIKVQKIIEETKEDMDFIIALKPSQVIAINKQESKSKKIYIKHAKTTKLKYMPLPNFRKYAGGKERKEIFFKYFFYLVESRNQEILKMRRRVISWKKDINHLSYGSKMTVKQLAKKYQIEEFDIKEVSSWNRLLKRLDIIPVSLALAQAAKESLWGTSRFARYGYNYYGQRCFSNGCGIVPKKRGRRKFEVTTFSSPREGVKSYIHNLNTHFAYEDLRKIRYQQRRRGRNIKGLALVNALGKYSERGSDYIKDLKSLIKYNHLAKYDIY